MSIQPSRRVTKKSPGRVGDQQPSVRYDWWYFVRMIGARISSSQMFTLQSPIDMK